MTMSMLVPLPDGALDDLHALAVDGRVGDTQDAVAAYLIIRALDDMRMSGMIPRAATDEPEDPPHLPLPRHDPRDKSHPNYDPTNDPDHPDYLPF